MSALRDRNETVEDRILYMCGSSNKNSPRSALRLGIAK